MAQRLVRILCKFCKKEKTPTEFEVTTIKSIIEGMRSEGKDFSKHGINPDAPIKMFEPVGCERCNKTGYHGRVGIYEAIINDAKIEEIMPQNPSEREIKQIAKTQGILSMRQDGVVKILNGTTSYEEVLSVVDLNEE